MESSKLLYVGSVLTLLFVGVGVLFILIQSIFPLNPKIIDITLPLEVITKEVEPDSFITYETTFTQYKRMDVEIITYLVSKANPTSQTQISLSETVLPRTENLHVQNNVYIPAGTAPGEYTISLVTNFKYNRFRTIQKIFDSETFTVLSTEATEDSKPGPVLNESETVTVLKPFPALFKLTCDHFATQSAAQSAFDASPELYSNLDQDNDKIACEYND